MLVLKCIRKPQRDNTTTVLNVKNDETSRFILHPKGEVHLPESFMYQNTREARDRYISFGRQKFNYERKVINDVNFNERDFYISAL